MQVQDVYFNFTSSLKSDVTRKRYEYCLSKFLKHCDLDLIQLLSLEQQELSNLIIRYLSSLKASNQYKNQILAAIKHIREIGQQVSKEVFNFGHIDIHLHLSGFRKCIVFPPQDMHPSQGLQSLDACCTHLCNSEQILQVSQRLPTQGKYR